MGKLKDVNKKIEETVVGGYKKVEDSVVGGYKKVEDKFVDTFLKKDGETTEEAKERVKKEQEELKKKNEEIIKNGGKSSILFNSYKFIFNIFYFYAMINFSIFII